jgi:peptide/nickel transport system permease protein
MQPHTRTLANLTLAAAVLVALVIGIVAFGGARTAQAAVTTVGLATVGLLALIAGLVAFRPPHNADARVGDSAPWTLLAVGFAMLTVVPLLVLVLAVPVLLTRRLWPRSALASYGRLRERADGYYRRLTTWMWLLLALGSTLSALILMLTSPKPLTAGNLEVWHWELLLLASPVIWAGAVILGGGPRARTILRQVGQALLTLFVISIVVFLMMANRSAQDIAFQKFGNQVTSAQVDAFAKEFGLEEPIHERYLDWASGFVKGDMGTSYVTNDAVAKDVMPRFQKTLTLAIISLLIAIPIAVMIGVYQAKRVGRWSDTSMLTGSVVLAALPEFVIAIALVMIFAVELGWLPTDSTALIFAGAGFTDTVKAYVLPTATLVLVLVPYASRIARTSVREALGAPYTQAALLRGLPRRTVVWDHAVRNASVPVVNAVGINIVFLLSGVVAVEYVFAFPGIGQGIVQATSTSDAFKIEAIAVLLGMVFISVSLLADLLVAYLNPRLKAATR